MTDTKRRACVWAEDFEGNWGTQCDQFFVIIDGNPIDNGMKFCCYCGGELVQMNHEETEDDDE